MTISYAIPVCNEWLQLEYLINYLLQKKRDQDEIVVQCDEGNTTPSVYQVLKQFSDYKKLKVVEFPLNKDFASFKNNLKKHCSGDWIVQVDADEMLGDVLINNIPNIIESNPYNDVYLVPRVNTVKGLTQEHIQKWGWNVNEKGWVNWPDYQWRIWKNKPEIKWVNKVHEKLEGFKSYTPFPEMEELALRHPKTIERQENQVKRYQEIDNNVQEKI